MPMDETKVLLLLQLFERTRIFHLTWWFVGNIDVKSGVNGWSHDFRKKLERILDIFFVKAMSRLEMAIFPLTWLALTRESGIRFSYACPVVQTEVWFT